MFSSILVPVDGSEHAKKALAVACRLVHEGSTLHLLHIPESLSHETPLVWGIGPVTLEASEEERERVGRQLITRAAEAAREQGAPRVETQLAQGDPVRTILSEARKHHVDAIVMGSRGLSDLQGFVVGSVSHKVSHAAECTVITVR
ncbi:universal stress protein [Halomonas heilongjiangensis]|uniref:Universal stress protein n=1 Tax=Halomonas heilongjiangensis TaxID=1387883 RepID=A0A2N7TV11_9GAMM|nr:universal stress protein [Halomonas heilongjiangensis]PMR72017.1 universal stress protein [Halomonas heilongjiangensis]PXX87975.1 universal stress protein [Halomonas heilongjiangensis]